LNWLAGIGEFIEEFVELPTASIPDFGIEDFASLGDDDIEKIAAQYEKINGLGDGPISDLTLCWKTRASLLAMSVWPQAWTAFQLG